MDPITHLLSGASIQGASRGLGFRNGLDVKSTERRALVMIIIVASILPDIDHLIFMPMGWEIYIKHHRGFTHSLFGAPFMALGAIYLVQGIYKLFKKELPIDEITNPAIAGYFFLYTLFYLTFMSKKRIIVKNELLFKETDSSILINSSFCY